MNMSREFISRRIANYEYVVSKLSDLASDLRSNLERAKSDIGKNDETTPNGMLQLLNPSGMLANLRGMMASAEIRYTEGSDSICFRERAFEVSEQAKKLIVGQMEKMDVPYGKEVVQKTIATIKDYASEKFERMKETNESARDVAFWKLQATKDYASKFPISVTVMETWVYALETKNKAIENVRSTKEKAVQKTLETVNCKREQAINVMTDSAVQTKNLAVDQALAANQFLENLGVIAVAVAHLDSVVKLAHDYELQERAKKIVNKAEVVDKYILGGRMFPLVSRAFEVGCDVLKETKSYGLHEFEDAKKRRASYC